MHAQGMWRDARAPRVLPRPAVPTGTSLAEQITGFPVELPPCRPGPGSLTDGFRQ